MTTLNDVKDVLTKKNFDFTETNTTVTVLKQGDSNGGKKIKLKLVIEEDHGRLLGYCTGLGDELIQVTPEAAIDAFRTRYEVHSHEFN